MGIKGRFLHIGCGHSDPPEWAEGCEEVRLDIDPTARADICASMSDMGDIGEFDVVYSSHCLEHLYPHEVHIAVGEVFRVLKKGGCAVIHVPNLENVKATRETVYISQSGPICGLDMFYGKSSMVEENRYMAHHCGFIPSTLEEVLSDAGFTGVKVTAMSYTLTGIGVKE